MIYTVISRLNEKDCRFMRQPSVYLPPEVEKYILDTKDEKTREERLITYTLLSLSLEKFYGIKGWNIEKNAYGKPFLVTNGEKSNIFISLSHSDGVAAVALSEEGEIGIDLQAEISPEREKRLKDRFFTNLEPQQDNLGVKYYFCDSSFELCKAEVEDIENPLNFTQKWSACEAMMKCDGRGFTSLPQLEIINKNLQLNIKEITLDKKRFSLSIVVKKAIM